MFDLASKLAYYLLAPEPEIIIGDAAIPLLSKTNTIEVEGS